MARTLILAALAAINAAACQEELPKTPRDEAQEVARSYLEAGGAYRASWKVSVTDSGTDWLVTYEPEKGWIGGITQVWVDKRTMKVTGSVAGQ